MWLAGMLTVWHAFPDAGCGFPWWMKPVDGCWIRIWCNGYAQKLLWIFFHLGHFIDFLELWTAIFGKNPKKRIFSHLHCYLCYGEVITLESGCWRHRETTGMAQSTPRCALGDFSNSGNPRNGGQPLKAIKNFSKWYVFTCSTLSDIFAKFGSDTCCGLRISTVKLLLKLQNAIFFGAFGGCRTIKWTNFFCEDKVRFLWNFTRWLI